MMPPESVIGEELAPFAEDFPTLNVITEADAVDISPEIAEKMLMRNTRNRQIKGQTVTDYAEAMQRGEWVYNGRAIVFSKEGILLDGQHTLRAVIEADRTIKCLVAIGLDHEVQQTMDSGRARTFGDTLMLMGVPNAIQTATIIRNVYQWETRGVPNSARLSKKPSVAQLLESYDRNDHINKTIGFIKTKESRMSFFPWLQAAPLYYIFWLHQPGDAQAFFKSLASGAGLETTSPIYQLREALLKDWSSEARMETYVKQALVIRAFNAWRQGKTSVNLRFRLGGANPDAFPEIVSLQGEDPYRFKNGTAGTEQDDAEFFMGDVKSVDDLEKGG